MSLSSGDEDDSLITKLLEKEDVARAGELKSVKRVCNGANKGSDSSRAQG